MDSCYVIGFNKFDAWLMNISYIFEYISEIDMWFSK